MGFEHCMSVYQNCLKDAVVKYHRVCMKSVLLITCVRSLKKKIDSNTYFILVLPLFHVGNDIKVTIFMFCHNSANVEGRLDF